MSGDCLLHVEAKNKICQTSGLKTGFGRLRNLSGGRLQESS